jgi:hypothetical protein
VEILTYNGCQDVGEVHGGVFSAIFINIYNSSLLNLATEALTLAQSTNINFAMAVSAVTQFVLSDALLSEDTLV